MLSVGRGQLFEMALIDPVWLNFTSLFDYKRNLNILKEMLFSRSFFYQGHWFWDNSYRQPTIKFPTLIRDFLW